MSQELSVYLNGEILEQSQARISPFDRGFRWGDGVYEVTPCFNRRLFRLGDHMDRLYRSLGYLQIDPGMGKEEMEKATLDLFERNYPLLAKEGIYRVGHWVTRGLDSPRWSVRDSGPATIFIYFDPFQVQAFADSYAAGAKLTVVATRRVPPECLEARAKVTSRLNQILAEMEANASGALALMLDMHGNVAENPVANFFMVREGVLWTPPERNVLEGVTRKVIFELADRLGIGCEERNFTLYDIAQAEEFFLSSSPLCALPVREVDGFRPKAPVPGPITRRLMKAFLEETGFDFSVYMRKGKG